MKYPQLISMPSAVSDWLEEQLEARGIDAVVYTRYVLSLLYRDPIDVICPDQDLHFTHPNKEVRRSGGGRKRFRRSSGWWGHDLSDAEKLKRSAAVECLMSASDQTCGIESLVDELCEKLKEINNNSSTNNSEQQSEEGKQKREPSSSPQDPAKRYYAAFPPLSRNSSGNSPSLITLIPKWFGSPKKRTPRKQSRSSSYEEKLHSKVELENMKARSAGKQRFNYFSRNKKDLGGYCRNVTKSMERSESTNEWELYMFNNNKRSPANWPPSKGVVKLEKVDSEENLKQAIVNAEENWKAIDDDANLNMYDDLPVDIRELLDSPNPQDDAVELMNLANMRDTGNKTFIQCGTNIISSIWSNDAAAMDDATTIYDNTYNAALDESSTESFLDLKFSSISIDGKWPTADDIIAENETNLYFEHFGKSLLLSGGDANLDSFGNVPWSGEKFEKWSDAENYENELNANDMSRSLLILNHSKESSFTEVVPVPRAGRAVMSIFGKNTNILKLTMGEAKNCESETEDDLLHSVRSHFKPINEKLEAKAHGHYVDGTTFIIPSNIDKVVYKRSESGYLYLEAAEASKKYLEYKHALDGKFSVKFGVRENDKACQTDLVPSPSELEPYAPSECEQDLFYFPGDQELLTDERKACTCDRMKLDGGGGDEFYCPVHLTQSDGVLAEIFGKCDNCDSKTTWDSSWFDAADKRFDRQAIRNIWSGSEVCTTCTNLNPPLTQLQYKLREDISQDGEQLLSDLSSIQKTYMEELPVAEVSCDISELIGGVKDCKRRHSSINYEGTVSMQEDCFSFASRLEEDCLMKIAAIPTLRSVTL